jgi:putative endonuclease
VTAQLWLPRDFSFGVQVLSGMYNYTVTMSLFSKLAFLAVRWKARRGLSDAEEPQQPASEQSAQEKLANKMKHRRTGMRGETYAYWYLRRLGYVFVARNYMPRGVKGELDLVGYDGATLAFVEVRTRNFDEQLPAQPEMSVTRAKQHVLIRTAHRFVADRHPKECPMRFDVLAIDNMPGRAPVVRLHKDAFSPELKRSS